MSAETIEKIERELREIEADLRLVRDPWVKRDLARRRRQLRDLLADLRERRS